MGLSVYPRITACFCGRRGGPDPDRVAPFVQRLLTLAAAAVLHADRLGDGLGAGLGDADRSERQSDNVA